MPLISLLRTINIKNELCAGRNETDIEINAYFQKLKGKK